MHGQSWSGILLLPHPLTNFQIQNYYRNEPKFNGAYSRNNLPKTKDRAFVINFDEFKSIRTHWIALYVNSNNRRASYNLTGFNTFGVEYIPKEIKKLMGNKNIMTNIYRIKAYYSIMRECFCIRFNGIILKGKQFLDYRNLFSPNDYEKNDN